MKTMDFSDGLGANGLAIQLNPDCPPNTLFILPRDIAAKLNALSVLERFMPGSPEVENLKRRFDDEIKDRAKECAMIKNLSL